MAAACWTVTDRERRKHGVRACARGGRGEGGKPGEYTRHTQRGLALLLLLACFLLSMYWSCSTG